MRIITMMCIWIYWYHESTGFWDCNTIFECDDDDDFSVGDFDQAGYLGYDYVYVLEWGYGDCIRLLRIYLVWFGSDMGYYLLLSADDFMIFGFNHMNFLFIWKLYSFYPLLQVFPSLGFLG